MKFGWRKLHASLALAAALTGCVATGTKVSNEQALEFVRGSTTVRDVVAKLGQPTSRVTLANGESMLLYQYGEVQYRAATFVPIVGLFAGGADVRSNSVSFRFDAEGKLIDHTSAESQQGVGTGIASGNVQGRVPDQPKN